MSLTRWAKTIQRESFEPVEVHTTIPGEKRMLYAHCTSVRMKHVGVEKVIVVVSYRNGKLDDREGPSFYVSNTRFWESKKMLQTQAMRWPIECFHRDAKQSLGLEDYQVRKIRGIKHHIAMVFFAYVLLLLGSGFERIMANLKANLRTTGSRCRLARTEILSSPVRFIMKMAHKDTDARKIMYLSTKSLERSGYWT